MHCPHCGKQSSADQKFCRSCGMSLEAVAKALAEHLSTSDQLVIRAGEARSLHRMYRMLFWGIMAALFGVALIAVGRKNELVSLPGLLISLAGMVVALYGILAPMRAKALLLHQAQDKVELGQAEQTIPLLGEKLAEPITSITERTTELFQVEGEIRKDRSTGSG